MPYGWGREEVMEKLKAKLPKFPTLNMPRTRQDIQGAFQRYMAQIYGGEGTAGYVKRQVQGVSDVMQPYMRAMSSKGAASLAGAGGLAGGAQATAQGQLMGQKVRTLGRATTTAQRDVAQTSLAARGLAQREGFGLSNVEIQRFIAELKKRMAQHQISIDWERLKREDPGFYDIFADVLEAGAQGAGYALGSMI